MILLTKQKNLNVASTKAFKIILLKKITELKFITYWLEILRVYFKTKTKFYYQQYLDKNRELR